MKYCFISLSLLLISCSSKHNPESAEFQLEIGDILFQDLDSSPLCDAIELVTPGFRNSNLSHVGIVVDIGDIYSCKYNSIEHTRILEAMPGGVTITCLDSFLMRSSDQNYNPKVLVGRLKSQYRYSIPSAINFLLSKIGDKYDEEFVLDNEKYYCSELIYEAFSEDTIFTLQPMTFLDPDTKERLDIWEKYYSEMNKKIPEGEPGINPGIMSLSNKIDIVHMYGHPNNYK